MEVGDMPKYMVCYSVQEKPNKVINSDLQQSQVIDAENEEEARRKLYKVESRKINNISSVNSFIWNME